MKIFRRAVLVRKGKADPEDIQQVARSRRWHQLRRQDDIIEAADLARRQDGKRSRLRR